MNSNRVPQTVREAKEQASEYFGFTASKFIQTDDGTVWEIPNPGLLDDDQQERWEELQFEIEGYDRDEDIVIPERVLDDGSVIPERRIKGDVLTPYRVNGQRISPPYNVRLAIVLWGEEGYKKYKAGGGIANQIALEWARMNKEFAERVTVDPKSDGSYPALEAVSEAD